MTLYRIDSQPNLNGVYVGGGIDPTERIAGAAVTPGAIVVPELTTDGECIEAGAAAVGCIGYALENGSAADPAIGTAKTLLTDFAAGENVRINRQRGSRFMGIILASSAALVEGDLLKTGAGGTLEKFVSGTDAPAKAVARYASSEDLTPGGTDARAVCILGAY